MIWHKSDCKIMRLVPSSCNRRLSNQNVFYLSCGSKEPKIWFFFAKNKPNWFLHRFKTQTGIVKVQWASERVHSGILIHNSSRDQSISRITLHLHFPCSWPVKKYAIIIDNCSLFNDQSEQCHTTHAQQLSVFGTYIKSRGRSLIILSIYKRWKDSPTLLLCAVALSLVRILNRNFILRKWLCERNVQIQF